MPIDLHYLFLIVFSFSITSQVFFTLYFSKIFWVKKKEEKNEYPPLSIIVSARNEASNLKFLIPHLLAQDYPEFEIIIINDRSQDNTNEVLSDYIRKHKGIKAYEITNFSESISPKKQALTFGISQANHDYFLFTDADCLPTSDQWAKNMVKSLSPQQHISLGLGWYQQPNHSLLQYFIQYETLNTAIQMVGFCLQQLPYMGLGRNLLYSRKAFLKSNGFKSHIHIKSGDDDLFVGNYPTPKEITCSIEKDASTISQPPLTFKEWFSQKTRHLSTGKHYKKDKLILLGTLQMSHGLLYLCVPIFWISNDMLLVFFILIWRLIIINIFNFALSKKLHGRHNIWLFPLMDILYPLYLNVVGSTAFFKKKFLWKN